MRLVIWGLVLVVVVVVLVVVLLWWLVVVVVVVVVVVLVLVRLWWLVVVVEACWPGFEVAPRSVRVVRWPVVVEARHLAVGYVVVVVVDMASVDVARTVLPEQCHSGPLLQLPPSLGDVLLKLSMIES